MPSDSKPTANDSRTIVWWGRADPAYSRNAVTRTALKQLGWSLVDFSPPSIDLACRIAARQLPKAPALVWVPCFRQRDLAGAARWAKQNNAALVFDPLISAYDKQVFEKQKFDEGSSQARRLLDWEKGLFALPDIVVADTKAHADYFHAELGVPKDKLAVVPVGAEPGLFEPKPMNEQSDRALEVLFYGSFIGLQGPETIARAAAHCPQANWCMLGDGPLKGDCMQMEEGADNLRFEPWIDYEKLPARIAQADILLGVFGSSAKAGRVVPNKVYQALACGRPVITRQGLEGVYPDVIDASDTSSTGLMQIEPAHYESLAAAVAHWSANRVALPALGQAARQTFENCFSQDAVRDAVASALARLNLPKPGPVS